MIQIDYVTCWKTNSKSKYSGILIINYSLIIIFSSLGLVLHFPDELLANLLNLFYSILLELEAFSVKTLSADVLLGLLM